VKKPTDHLFSLLTPRQPITSTPYALRTLAATSADTLSSACTLCVTDAHIQAVDGSKVTGTVPNAANASTAVNVTGVVQIANGGTGSATKNFVDLNTDQTVSGNKTFAGTLTGNGSGLTNLNGANITNNTVNASALAADTFPNSRNLSLLGSLRWDRLKSQKDFTVGTSPAAISFDGTSIWVANSGSNNVNKLGASDGAAQGTFSVGSNPIGIAFDGLNVWIANKDSGNVTKLRASDGAGQGIFAVDPNPQAIAFDGTNIWSRAVQA
jgi:hypothetical protein